jgi:hypothetical protein
MTTATSSAIPADLQRYSNVLCSIDADVAGACGSLASCIARFESSCREYPVRASHLPPAVHTHASSSAQVDTWVGKVGAGFLLADGGNVTVALTGGVQRFGKSALTHGEGTLKFALENADYANKGRAVWDIVKDRRALAAWWRGVKFHRRGSVFQSAFQQLTGRYKGGWTVTGSRKAIKSVGIKARHFKLPYLQRKLARAGSGLGKGFMSHLPRNSVYHGLRSTPAQLKEAFKAGRGVKGVLKSAAFLTAAVDLAENVYEFTWGKNADKGWKSREFVTATVTDVSVGVSIVAVSTVVGSLIPVPFLGTAVGFAVGVGLQHVYDTYLQDKWRGAVDRAGQAIQRKVTDTVRVAQHAVLERQRSVARAASALGRGLLQQAGRTLREAVTRPLWSPPRFWVAAAS